MAKKKIPAEVQVLMLISPVTQMTEHVKAILDEDHTVDHDLDMLKMALIEDKDDLMVFSQRIKAALDVAAMLNVLDEDKGRSYLEGLYFNVLTDEKINARISVVTDELMKDPRFSHLSGGMPGGVGNEVNTGDVSNQGGYL